MSLVVDMSSKAAQALMPMLIQKGYPVRTFTQDACQLQYAQSLGVAVIEGDMRQPDALLRACEGAEAVVSSVDSTNICQLIETARRFGVRQFVLISTYRARFDHSDNLWHTEAQREEYLKASGLGYTILRPTAFMDVWCNNLGMQVMDGQPVTILGDGKNPINFISAQDVAKFIIFSLEDPRLCNQTLTIGGPENLTFEEVVFAYEKVLSRCVTRKHISALQMKLMSVLYAPFDKTRARLMATQRELATSNWQVDMTETIKHFPINLMSLEEWIVETSKQMVF